MTTDKYSQYKQGQMGTQQGKLGPNGAEIQQDK